MFAVEPQGTTFADYAPMKFRDKVALPRTLREWAFEAVANPAAMTQWWPGLRRVEWLTPGEPNVGSERLLETRWFTRREKVIAWHPPRSMAFTVVEAKVPLLRSMVVVVTFEPYDARGTRVEWLSAIDETWMGGLARKSLEKLVRAPLDAMPAYFEAEARRRRGQIEDDGGTGPSGSPPD